jgi:predicted transposase/invertase (TIGR01784 family)
MAESLTDPHDCFFRETFSRREVAEDFLKNYLPPALVDRIDWPSLAITKDTFVEKALRKHFSDLVYDARYGTGKLKIYLLLEHKSHPDPWVSLQLLRYQVRIWELHRKQHPDQKLPPIVPLVLYHGKHHWRIPDRFEALFEAVDTPLQPYLPAFRHELCDLHLPAPEAIRGTVLNRLILLALKHVFDPQPQRTLAKLLRLVREILNRDTALEMLEVLLRYYVQASGALDERAIRELIESTVDGEDTMQTFIDRYIEQGRQQGLSAGKQEGLREGRQQGLLTGKQKGLREGLKKGLEKGLEKGLKEGLDKGLEKGRQDVLFRLMTRKFGPLTAEQRQRLEQADEETLLRWAEQVLFAETPDEALR